MINPKAFVQVTIFDKFGIELSEIQTVGAFSWRLTEEGQGSLFVPFNDPACRSEIISISNLVLVRFQDGLPDWGGVMDTPINITEEGVNATVYTPEHMWSWRRTSKRLVSTQLPSGPAFKRILDDLNATHPASINPTDTIYGGGLPRTREYNYSDPFSAIRDLASSSGHEWVITPVLRKGVLSFSASWYDKCGLDKSATVELINNQNAYLSLGYQGQIVNHLHVAGQGVSWTPDRMDITVSDAYSRFKYGFREYSIIQPDVGMPESLASDAKDILMHMKDPQKILSGTVLDLPPARFSQYGIGDTIAVSAFHRGGENWALIKAKFRLHARERLVDGTCNVVLIGV